MSFPMESQQTELKLRQIMETARAEYRRLNAIYDSLLADAHSLDGDTAQSLQFIARANRLGPSVSAALKTYHDSVEELAQFYLKEASRLRSTQK
jgi:hypothetical protein